VTTNQEFDLEDVLATVYRRRYVFIIAFIVIFLGIVVRAAFSVRTYSYTTALQIGSIPTGTGTQPVTGPQLLESPETLQAKLTQSFIPDVLAEYKARASNDKTRYNISVSIPDKSGVVVLALNAPQTRTDAAKKLLQEVTDNVIANDQQTYEVLLQGLQGSQKQARQKLSDLDAQFGAKQDEIKNLARVTDRAAKEATTLQEFISNGSRSAGNSAGDGSSQKLIMNNQIAAARQRLGDLNDQLKFSIPSQRIQLQNDLVQIEQQQWQQQLVVSQLETDLKLAQNTRQISPPSQSLYPVGSGRLIQVLLGTLAAVVFAFLTVYIVVLLGNVREKILNNQDE
jgi:hypothetical protein